MTDKTKVDGAAEPVSRCCQAPKSNYFMTATSAAAGSPHGYCSKCGADFTPAEQPIDPPPPKGWLSWTDYAFAIVQTLDRNEDYAHRQEIVKNARAEVRQWRKK